MRSLQQWFATLVFAFLLAPLCFATIDQYKFDDKQVQERFLTLIADLRCPKCQNQNLSDSNAEIAQDLRNEIYRLLDEGYTDQEIVDHLVARYGEFVRYKPPINSETLVLWFAPAILLLLGVVVIVSIVFSQRKKLQQPVETLSAEEQAKLDELTKEQN